MKSKSSGRFSLVMLMRLIRQELKQEKRYLNEDELKKMLGGHKCPDCNTWFLGEREQDEHLCIESLLKYNKKAG